MRRSAESNRRYWLLIHAISEGVRPKDPETGERVQYGPKAWHEYMKEHFLGALDVKMPNGKVRTEAVSSAELDKAEFRAYMEQVEFWAGEHDVWLADIEDAA